jgi:hypothetical protein
VWAGKKALRDAQKLSERRGSGDGGKKALRDAQQLSQRRSGNGKGKGDIAGTNSSNTTTVENGNMDGWKTMRGSLQIKLQDSWEWCDDKSKSSPRNDDIFAKVQSWILLVLKDGVNFSYAATDITVEEFSEALTIGNASHNITYSPRASRSTSIWTYLVSKPPPASPGGGAGGGGGHQMEEATCQDNKDTDPETCQECVGAKSITLDVFIQVKDKDHREEIAKILTADLLQTPLPNDGISTPQANVTCPIQDSGCTCPPSPPSGDHSSGAISFESGDEGDCAWIIAADNNKGAFNLKVSGWAPGLSVYECSSSSCNDMLSETKTTRRQAGNIDR